MMKTLTSYIATAALAVGGVAFVGCDREETTTSTRETTTVTTKTDTPTTTTTGDRVNEAVDSAGNRIGNAADRAGEAMKSTGQKIGDAVTGAGGTLKPGGTGTAPDAEDIRDVLGSVVETAVKKGTFDDLVERFVDADRNRLGQGGFAEQTHAALDQKAEQFLNDWKAKYGEDFDIRHMEVLPESFAMIKQGEVGKAAAGVDVDAKVGDGSAKVNVDNRTGVDSPDKQSADANKNDPGRNIATVTIMASHGMPQLQIPMVHEFPDAWKIDLKDDVDGPKLRDNILKHLTMVADDKAKWPADKTEAYRVVTHHILMGVLGM